jgi:transposase
VDFSEQVLGQGRIGVRLASMIAYLRTVMRLPLRQLRDVLRDLHGMPIILGELVELLHRMKEHSTVIEHRAEPVDTYVVSTRYRFLNGV